MGDSRNGMRARPGAWARWIVRVGMPVACASSLAAQRPPVGAAVGTAIGDSLRFAVTIDSLDAARQVAWFAGRGSARFLVLAVVPGKDIELIVPDGGTRRLIRERGRQRVDLSRTVNVENAALTAAALAHMAARLGVDMPISRAVDAIINRAADIDAAIGALLARPLKPESA